VPLAITGTTPRQRTKEFKRKLASGLEGRHGVNQAHSRPKMWWGRQSLPSVRKSGQTRKRKKKKERGWQAANWGKSTRSRVDASNALFRERTLNKFQYTSLKKSIGRGDHHQEHADKARHQHFSFSVEGEAPKRSNATFIQKKEITRSGA